MLSTGREGGRLDSCSNTSAPHRKRSNNSFNSANGSNQVQIILYLRFGFGLVNSFNTYLREDFIFDRAERHDF
jgi:hypothetical protein